ncbi:hypothetical protein PU630_07230 [Microbacterium horticulturae]|uniref:Meckel syndrome type 1 protein n=1 Tax=Microbacterium horticulturae TaxID=3028316 RepID=A0ABY8C1K2_9MICO|nr:hypothetical protein [Microbacterium sp. KACC 23027]WEG10334.1 hypothetical protein PU630_07230 [Microbacterium sp. KACC 23027]
MSTPDQPLTRRQIRELRNTGVTPVIAPAAAPDASESGRDAADDATEAVQQPAPAPEPVTPSPLPRAAAPAPVHTAPVPDHNVDLGATPLTRRQARQQERIRTASVPVITPDVAGAGASVPSVRPAGTAVVERSPWAPPVDDAPEQSARSAAAPAPVATPEAEPEPSFEKLLGVDAPAEDEAPRPGGATPPSNEKPVLNPAFGAKLLSADAKAPEPAASFEQLLTRDTASSGSASAPHALIMSQTSAPLVAPIAGTGEVLVTGTFALPEGLGSTGHAIGTADGKEVDAILVDGELPAHSSPTPIAASAAVSTIKTNDEVMQAPAPEKGGKLMLSLAITAGVLALALVGVLVYALASGVIS